MSKNRFDVVWEDDDTGFDDFSRPSESSSEDFKTMLLEEDSSQDNYYQKGTQLTGIISKIPESGDVLIDLDKKTSALMQKSDFMTNYAGLTVGDEITAFFTGYQHGAIILEHSLSASANSGQALNSAFEAKTPVKGKVTGSNKGGFEVLVLGKKAFCPVSQIDTKFVENMDEYVGKDFLFLVTKHSSRDVVVSRRDFLKLQEKEALIKLQDNWQDNPIVEGSIAEIKDFGVIIDIAGVGGLCHISEMSHQRIGHPSEKYKVGDRVTVKVTDLDTSSDRPKLSLSIKQAEKDPWEDVSEKLSDGDTLKGSITRLADFGAFVELFPGLEGLIHISEMSWEKRIHHPKDILSVGDSVEVRVLSIDTLKQRISLTMKNYESDPWKSVGTEFKIGGEYEGLVTSLKNFGAFVELKRGVDGLIPLKTLQQAFGPKYRKEASPPKKIKVKVVAIDLDSKKILLSAGNVESHTDEVSAFDQEFKDYQTETAKNEDLQKASKATGAFGDILSDALRK